MAQHPAQAEHRYLPAIRALLRPVDTPVDQDSLIMTIIQGIRTGTPPDAAGDLRPGIDHLVSLGNPEDKRSLLNALLDQASGDAVLAQRSNRIAILESTISPTDLLGRSLRQIINNPPAGVEPVHMVMDTVVNNLGPGARDTQIQQLIDILQQMRD